MARMQIMARTEIMQSKLQEQIAFYLTGRVSGPGLGPLDETHRPALFARYDDLSSLRYDFPLVLDREATPEQPFRSLSRLVDEAVEALGDDIDRDRVARHGYRIEREIRQQSAAAGSGDFASLWSAAAEKLSGKGDGMEDSAKRLWKAFNINGTIADVDAELPNRVVLHAWQTVQARKAGAFRQKAERLLQKLRDILDAEVTGSTVGRLPERLRAGVGASFAGTFDFEAMSRILDDAKPGFELSDERRRRINGLISVLEQQRFYSLEPDGPPTYSFAFDRCSDALDEYRERREEAVELVRALAIAELETSGEYRESVHDAIFEHFGANGLAAGELADLPDYLITTDAGTLDAAEAAKMTELLAAGLPVKVLLRTDDILEPSTISEGHMMLRSLNRSLVDTAIGLNDVFVLQASSSHLYQVSESLIRALEYDGPALFSIFSGAGLHTGNIPAYLVAAAASESRAFPALVYDPSAGPTQAARFKIDDNPSPFEDWPVQTFTYEDTAVQTRSEELAFTLADFMAMDDRFSGHFAIARKSDWHDEMIMVPAALETEAEGMPGEVPYVMVVDADQHLSRAVVDSRVLQETRRCLGSWHSLQELGGVHNSHAEQLLARERASQTAVIQSPAAEVPVEAAAAPEPASTVAVTEPEPAPADDHGDDPYIETARCTTCNECTNLNNRMFAYNSEKQAYIADPDAGTYRQLVEAAEGCQVSIIHPGKPRNPKEPGLDDLITRAAEFNWGPGTPASCRHLKSSTPPAVHFLGRPPANAQGV